MKSSFSPLKTDLSHLRSPRPFAAPCSKTEKQPLLDWGALAEATDRALQILLSLQKPDGHWCGELEGDTILESEYVLLLTILGRLGDPKIGKCARYIVGKQGSDGGWSNYPGGPADLSITVKAYFALKIAGYSPDSGELRRASSLILEMGGAERVNSFTRFYLAALAQIPYEHCPSVPPELVLLPKWFPINLYAMSAWTRTIVVPLSIFYAYKPVTDLPRHLGIAELFRKPPWLYKLSPASKLEGRLCSWPNFFRLTDRLSKLYGKIAPRFLRQRALKKAEQWMLERFEGSDGLGAIFPPMVYTVLALKCLGYGEDSAEMRWAEQQLEDLILEEDDTIRLQPCFSPVWDTAWAMVGLAGAGLPADHPALLEASDWLLEREIRKPGDWSLRDPDIQPSGWAFEYRNDHYADLDDTAAVLLALRRSSRFDGDRCRHVVQRGLDFLLKMQCRDGGWAAFDKDIDNKVLEAIPFADHNAMLDPSCPDITARVLELLGQFGHRRGEPMIDEAIRFLLENQEPEGCWTGRWGVNYIYGTWQTLVGLASIDYDLRHPRIRKAADWLKSVQQETGGWGESCRSYSDRSWMGRGEPTPSQTAWAILGLIAAGETSSGEVQQGIGYLLRTQRSDGTWEEPYFTGTGFPLVFYLRYHYYRLYFPLIALTRYRAAVAPEASQPGVEYPTLPHYRSA